MDFMNIKQSGSSDSDSSKELCPGSIVSSSHASYMVVTMLGEGGFGAVYDVCESDAADRHFALKVEPRLAFRKGSKLKMEVAILKELARVRGTDNRHFVSMADRGKSDTFYFVVMQLLGKSLASLKKEAPKKIFSLGTGFGVSVQCLEAIESLHAVGYVHRDIKPANFAVGRDDRARIVHLIDFGLARRYINSSGEIKTPRKKIGFRGTIKFASLNAHLNRECGPRDDCESWFYQLLNLVVANDLPWSGIHDEEKVVDMKKRARLSRGTLFGGLKCENELSSVFDYIEKLQYPDRVDYSFLSKMLDVAAKTTATDLNAPYDWEVTNDKQCAPEPAKQLLLT